MDLLKPGAIPACDHRALLTAVRLIGYWRDRPEQAMGFSVGAGSEVQRVGARCAAAPKGQHPQTVPNVVVIRRSTISPVRGALVASADDDHRLRQR